MPIFSTLFAHHLPVNKLSMNLKGNFWWWRQILLEKGKALFKVIIHIFLLQLFMFFFFFASVNKNLVLCSALKIQKTWCPQGTQSGGAKGPSSGQEAAFSFTITVRSPEQVVSPGLLLKGESPSNQTCFACLWQWYCGKALIATLFLQQSTFRNVLA